MTPDGRKWMLRRQVLQRRAGTRRGPAGFGRPVRSWINVAGNIGIPMRVGRVHRGFVLPYNAPGLGEMFDDHLSGLEGFSLKRLKKGLKKIVKSKLFKYAAIGTAAYFAAPYVAGQMGASGLGRKQAVKFIGGKALQLLKKKKKIAVPLFGTGLLASAVGAQPGSVAARSLTPSGMFEGASTANPAGTIPGEYGFTPEHPEDYQYSVQPSSPYGSSVPTTIDTTATPAERAAGASQLSMLGLGDMGSIVKVGLAAGAVYLGYRAITGSSRGRRRRR